MLKIEDLAVNTELDSKTMKSVVGGVNPLIAIDNSFTSDNKVVDMDQLFDFKFTQINAGDVTNNQALDGGNGRMLADVKQALGQGNDMRISTLGNAHIA